MPKPMGLLVAAINYANAPQDEFNDWYDLEHVPERLRIPGFLTAERWLGTDDPTIAVATYDLDSLDVLDSPPYRAISSDNLSPWSKRVIDKCERIVRFDAEQMPPGRELGPDNAGGMLLIAMNVKPEAEVEYNAWYDEEHIPRLKTVPGVLCARRFRTRVGPRKYSAIYHLSAPEVQASEAWATAITTPWQQRMRPQTSDRLRLVLKRDRRKTPADVA
jgi:hypothetical protein